MLLGAALVVVSINAVNLFDGLDGLAGTAGLLAALGSGWMAVMRGLDPTFGLVLAGAVAGFLVLNWHRARVFLGDNGSYVVGLFIAYAVLRATPSGAETRLVVAASLLGVFLLDLVATVLRRRLNGRPLFAGDRGHLYDQLRSRGLSVPAVVLVAGGVQASFVIFAVLVDQLAPFVAVASLAALGLVALALLAAGGFLSADRSA